MLDQTGQADPRGDLREPDQIGEQDRRLLDPVGDHDLAVVEPGHDLAGQDIAQQDLVFLALLLDPLQIAALALAPALRSRQALIEARSRTRLNGLGR